MNFNKSMLAASIFSALLVGAAQAAMSDPTPKVVGHKPVMTFAGNKPTSVKLGDTISVTDTDFVFGDVDGDAEAERNYVWRLDGVDTGVTGLSYSIDLAAIEKVDKVLTLAITPKTVVGDPISGDELVVDFGVIGVDATAAPIISALTMTGTLQVGQNLGATYAFNPNGGDLTDKSTFKWGRVGATAGLVAGGAVVAATQKVDDYALTVADVGEVVELSVQAKNSIGVAGNVMTVTSSELPDGGSGGEVVDPEQFAVRIIYNSSATAELNGPDYSGRPVVGKDQMTAECKYAAAPDGDFATCDTSGSAPYTLQWKGTEDGSTYSNLSEGVSGATYMPNANHQGQQIGVELTNK